MMATKHSAFQEDLAAYALGALDAEAAGALERHLQTCRSCQSELAGYNQVCNGLLQTVPARTPPRAIRSRLRARLNTGGRSRPRAWNWAWTAAPAIGAVVLMLIVSVASWAQLQSVRAQQAEIERRSLSTQTFVAMLAYPNTRATQFAQQGISGSLLLDQDRGLVGLFVWNLPPAEAGSTYEIWLIDANGRRTSGGFLEPEAGYAFVTAVIRPAGPLAAYKGLGVTTEPAGGSAAPTGPRVFGVDF